jgi:hypothetical protein
VACRKLALAGGDFSAVVDRTACLEFLRKATDACFFAGLDATGFRDIEHYLERNNLPALDTSEIGQYDPSIMNIDFQTETFTINFGRKDGGRVATSIVQHGAFPTKCPKRKPKTSDRVTRSAARKKTAAEAEAVGVAVQKVVPGQPVVAAQPVVSPQSEDRGWSQDLYLVPPKDAARPNGGLDAVPELGHSRTVTPTKNEVIKTPRTSDVHTDMALPSKTDSSEETPGRTVLCGRDPVDKNKAPARRKTYSRPHRKK